MGIRRDKDSTAKGKMAAANFLLILRFTQRILIANPKN